MELLGYAVIAFAPGLFWLWFFVRGRTYRPKPRRLLVYAFVLGMLFTAPAAALEAALLWGTDIRVGASLAAAAAAMLFVVGPVEELSKFMAVRLGPYRSLYFEEPRDGLVYAVAASLGFASVENLVYILSFGPEVMVGRAPFSTLAHVIFGSFWGVGTGHQGARGKTGARTVAGWWSHYCRRRARGVQHPAAHPVSARADAHSATNGTGAVVDAQPVPVGATCFTVPVATQLSQGPMLRLWGAEQHHEPVLPVLWTESSVGQRVEAGNCSDLRGNEEFAAGQEGV